MKTFYHVTPKSNLESILKYGLNVEMLNPTNGSPELLKKKLEEKGIDTTKIDFSAPIPQPTYRTLGLKIIWLGDEGIVEKYRNAPVFNGTEMVGLKVNLPDEWLEENQIPCPALYGKENFEDWLEYTKNFTDPVSRVIEGLGLRHTSPEDMVKRYDRRKRMVTVKSTIPPEWLEIIPLN